MASKRSYCSLLVAALIALLVSAFPCAAQPYPEYQWTYHFGSFRVDSGHEVVVDSSNNVIVAGGFGDTFDFDPSGGVEAISAPALNSLFVTKYNSSGVYQWTQYAGASTEEVGMDVDSSGNVFVAGAFWGTVDFNPKGTADSHTAAGQNDLYVTKYGTDGSHVWTIAMGGTEVDVVHDLTVDDSGNFIITGRFQNTIDFDPSGATANLTASWGHDIFIAKYDNDGNYLWAYQLGGDSGDYGDAVTTDSTGNVYVAGRFHSGSVDFDPTGTTETHNSANTGLFITKYSPSGTYLWTRSFGGAGSERPLTILPSFDESNIVVGGWFEGSADFDASGYSANRTSNGGDDGFIVTYSALGSFVSVSQVGGGGDDQIASMTFDAFGNFYYTGTFAGSVDLDPTAGTDPHTAAGGDDIFISKIAAAGSYEWSLQLGDTGEDDARGIAVAPNGYFYNVGHFENTVDFDPGAPTDNHVSGGGGEPKDYYITKYYDPALFNITGTITVGGNPLSGVTVNGGALGSTSTNSSGIYSYTSVVQNTAYTLTPTLTGYTFSPTSVSSTLVADATHDFTATLNTYSISGTITDGSSPISGVTVDGGPLGNATTNSSGVFTFSSVNHGTVYTITPTLAGYTFAPTNASATLTSIAVHNFTGTLGTYALSGTVTDGTNPLGAVTINGGSLGNVSTDAAGNFSYSNVPYGTTYTLTPSRTGYLFAPGFVSGTITGAAYVSFTGMQDVADAVSLSGRVLDNDGNPVAGAIVVLLGVNQDGAYQTTTAADGTYQFSGVSLGSYQLYANIGQVTIAQEDFVLDGSSPTEVKDLPMDQTTSFAGSVYGLWNSFFGMQNIVEVHNKGSEMLTAVLSIYGLGGVAPFPDSHMVVNFKVRAGEKIDIILNSLGQFENNRYGYIKITGSHGDFDGGVSMYGPEADGSGDFAFSVYTPFRTTLSNNSYLLYNTFAPGTLVDSELLTPNWLALVNLEDSQQKFQVRYYSATGQVFGVSTIVATANSRVDLDGGHIVAGARQVGFIEVVPPSAKANYLASLMRYSTTASGQTPRSATLIPAVYAGSSTHYLPLTVLDRTQSVVEIANLSDTSNQIQLTWYNAAGSYVDSDSFSMRAHSVIHVPCGTYLTSSSSGMLRVAGAANSSIAVQMMVYHYSADWSLESVQYSSGVEGVSQRLTGAYNLYLGMANWLRIMNITDVALRVQIGIDALANPTTIVLPAHARRDIALHELDIPLNSYGQFTLQASTAGAIAAELVRAKQGETGVEFLATVPVR